jgi:hypothetical protein
MRDPSLTRRLVVTAIALEAASFGVTPLWAAAPVASSSARENEVDRRALARTLADEGYSLYESGRYKDALHRSVRADAAFHATTIVLMAARCDRALGRLKEAAMRFEAVLEEPLTSGAPDAFREAREAARQALAALTPKLSRVRVDPPLEDGEVLRVDGDEVRQVSRGARVFVAPGRHGVEVWRGGAVVGTFDIEAAAAEELSIDTRQYVSGAPVETGAGRAIGGGVALGLAAVGLVTGITTGVLALDENADLEAVCPTKRCAPEHAAIADAANRFATISTIGFVAAGLGAAVGIGVLAWPRSGSDRSATTGRATLTLELAPTSAWLRGRF